MTLTLNDKARTMKLVGEAREQVRKTSDIVVTPSSLNELSLGLLFAPLDEKDANAQVLETPAKTKIVNKSQARE